MRTKVLKISPAPLSPTPRNRSSFAYIYKQRVLSFEQEKVGRGGEKELFDYVPRRGAERGFMMRSRPWGMRREFVEMRFFGIFRRRNFAESWG